MTVAKVIRLIAVVGPWQLISAVSALKQRTQAVAANHIDYLILYEHFSKSKNDFIDNLANSIWKWEAIHWLDNENDFITSSKRNLIKTKQAIKNKLQLDYVDEIWACHLNTKKEKILFETYTDSIIFLYEDGLQSYVPYKPFKVNIGLLSHPFKAKRLLSSLALGKDFHLALDDSIYGRCLYNEHLERLSGLYFILSDLLPVSDLYKNKAIKAISSFTIRDTIHSIKINKSLDFSSLEKIDFLILGQYFSKFGYFSRNTEIGIYRTILSKLDKNSNIYWKEHPGCLKNPYFNNVNVNLKIKPFDFANMVPIEVLVPHIKLGACVSVTSSSLFYLQCLYNIPTYTLKDSLKLFKNGDMSYISQLVSNNIKDISSLKIF